MKLEEEVEVKTFLILKNRFRILMTPIDDKYGTHSCLWSRRRFCGLPVSIFMPESHGTSGRDMEK